MRLVIQRVGEASVTIDGEVVGAIGRGLLVLVGVEHGDTEADVDWLAAKTVALRIFEDEAGVMNRSVSDVGGEVLAVSLHSPRRRARVIVRVISGRQVMTWLCRCMNLIVVRSAFCSEGKPGRVASEPT